MLPVRFVSDLMSFRLFVLRRYTPVVIGALENPLTSTPKVQTHPAHLCCISGYRLGADALST